MGKIILEKILDRIESRPGAGLASKFSQFLNEEVRKEISDPLEVERAKCEVIRIKIKRRRESLREKRAS